MHLYRGAGFQKVEEQPSKWGTDVSRKYELIVE
jgi:hypothetical protein